MALAMVRGDKEEEPAGCRWISTPTALKTFSRRFKMSQATKAGVPSALDY